MAFKVTNYSGALPAQGEKKSLTEFVKELDSSHGRERSSDWRLFQAEGLTRSRESPMLFDGCESILHKF